MSQNSITMRTDNYINLSFHCYEDTTRVTKGKVQRDNSRFVNHLPDRCSDWRLMGVHTIADHTKTSRLVDSVISSISIAAPPSFAIQILSDPFVKALPRSGDIHSQVQRGRLAGRRRGGNVWREAHHRDLRIAIHGALIREGYRT